MADVTSDILWRVYEGQLQAFYGGQYRSVDFGGELNMNAGSVSDPGLGFVGDTDTGFYAPGADAIGVVAGGVEAVRYTEASDHVLQDAEMQNSITASITQTQGQVPLTSSFNSVGTVANANDVVTMPAASKGREVTIVNLGANVLQVFPASGDNIGAGVDTSITIPVGEARHYVASDATNWTAITGVTSLTGFVNTTGTPADNQIAVFTDADTVEGTTALTFNGTTLSTTGSYEIQNGGGNYAFQSTNRGALLNEAATATNPSVVPQAADPDTGIGLQTLDALSLIAGGLEIARAVEAAGDASLIVDPGVTGTATAPSLAFGDGDSGFYQSVDDVIRVTLAGVGTWNFTGTEFATASGTGPRLQNETASATNPTFNPHQSDADTGIGWSAADALSLISGGVEAVRYTELNSGVIPAPNANVAVTAFATGGQASATQLDEGYNILTTVATAGDSVKLPPTFAVNSVIYVKNDGAAAADIFPATGDDLGAGLNTAVSLSSGGSIAFIATVADSTWTQLIPEGGATFPLLAPDGTAAAPSYSFSGDPDTGFFSTGANDIGIALGGTEEFQFIDTNNVFRGAAAGGPGLRNVAASAIGPNIYVDADDTNTGLGSSGNDAVTLIAGGITGIDVVEATSIISITYGNSASGTHTFTGSVLANQAAGPGFFDEDASSTNPTLVPNQADPDTGLGRSGVDELSLITGGAERVRVSASQVRGLDGTVSLPGYTFLSDPDTGVFNGGADVLAFGAGGVEGMRISEAAGVSQVEINQGTNDAPFFDFQATADADATSAISTLTTSGATTHHIQIEINGVTAWIAASTTDPT